MKILALSGGGARGVYSAYYLNLLEKEGIKASDFDLIVGTSVGSIIASFLTLGFSAREFFKLMKKNNDEIFEKKVSNPDPWESEMLEMVGNFAIKMASSKFEIENLKNVLRRELKNKGINENIKMQDIKKPLMIPCANLGNGNTYIVKSNYVKGFNSNKEMELVDAIASSCAFPTFFDSQLVYDDFYEKNILADGGMFANNPSMIGIVEALSPSFNERLKDIKVLSIGTGKFNSHYTEGIAMQVIDPEKFIKYLIDINSNHALNQASILLKDNYLHLDVELENKKENKEMNFYDENVFQFIYDNLYYSDKDIKRVKKLMRD